MTLSETGEMLPFSFNARVVTGFGRGSKELGCPTANLDVPVDLESGVYAGYARVEGTIRSSVPASG